MNQRTPICQWMGIGEMKILLALVAGTFDMVFSFRWNKSNFLIEVSQNVLCVMLSIFSRSGYSIYPYLWFLNAFIAILFCENIMLNRSRGIPPVEFDSHLLKMPRYH